MDALKISLVHLTLTEPDLADNHVARLFDIRRDPLETKNLLLVHSDPSIGLSTNEDCACTIHAIKKVSGTALLWEQANIAAGKRGAGIDACRSLTDFYHYIANLAEKRLEGIRHTMPVQQPVWLTWPSEEAWQDTMVQGNCSMNPSIQDADCRFTHPWIPDDVDPWTYNPYTPCHCLGEKKEDQWGREGGGGREGEGEGEGEGMVTTRYILDTTRRLVGNLQHFLPYMFRSEDPCCERVRRKRRSKSIAAGGGAEGGAGGGIIAGAGWPRGNGAWGYNYPKGPGAAGAGAGGIYGREIDETADLYARAYANPILIDSLGIIRDKMAKIAYQVLRSFLILATFSLFLTFGYTLISFLGSCLS